MHRLLPAGHTPGRLSFSRRLLFTSGAALILVFLSIAANVAHVSKYEEGPGPSHPISALRGLPGFRPLSVADDVGSTNLQLQEEDGPFVWTAGKSLAINGKSVHEEKKKKAAKASRAMHATGAKGVKSRVAEKKASRQQPPTEEEEDVSAERAASTSSAMEEAPSSPPKRMASAHRSKGERSSSSSTTTTTSATTSTSASSSSESSSSSSESMWKRLWGRMAPPLKWSLGGESGGGEVGKVIELGGQQRRLGLSQHADYLRAVSEKSLWTSKRQISDGAAEEKDMLESVLTELRGNRTMEARAALADELMAHVSASRLWSVVEKELPKAGGSEMTLIEWAGDGQQAFVSVKAAIKFPNATVLSVRQNRSSLAQVSRLRSLYGLGNLLLSPGPDGAMTPPALASLKQAMARPCTYQLLWDLPSLVGDDLLPHEVEGLLGAALQLCSTTFLPGRLPPQRFFAYWESMDALVHAALRSTDAAGRAAKLHSLSSQSSSSSSYYSSWYSRNEADDDDEICRVLKVEVDWKPAATAAVTSSSSSSSFSSSSSRPLYHSSSHSSSSSWHSPSGYSWNSYVHHGTPEPTSSSTSSSNETDDSASSKPSEEVASSSTAVGFSLLFLQRLGLSPDDTAGLARDVLRLATWQGVAVEGMTHAGLVRKGAALVMSNDTTTAEDGQQEEAGADGVLPSDVSLADLMASLLDGEDDASAAVGDGSQVTSGASATEPEPAATQTPSPSAELAGDKGEAGQTAGDGLQQPKGKQEGGAAAAEEEEEEQEQGPSEAAGAETGLEGSTKDELQASEDATAAASSAVSGEAGGAADPEAGVAEAGASEEEEEEELVPIEVEESSKAGGETQPKAAGGAAVRGVVTSTERRSARRRLVVRPKRSLAVGEAAEGGRPSDLVLDLMEAGVGVGGEEDEDEAEEGLWWSSRVRKAQDEMAAQQAPVLAAWSAVLNAEELGGGPRSWSMLLHGESLGLLSIKLARRHRDCLLVLVCRDGTHAQAHVELSDLLRLSNTLVGVTRLSLPTLAAVEAGGSAPHFQVISADTLSSFFFPSTQGSDGSCDLDHAEAGLSALLSLSTTSFLELPPLPALLRAIDLLHPSCSLPFRARYVARNPYISTGMPELILLHRTLPSASVRILRAAPTDSATPAPKTTAGHPPAQVALVRVDLKPDSRRPMAMAGSGSALSVYTLLHLGLVDSQRSRLLRLFLTMPIWRLRDARASPLSLRYFPSTSSLDSYDYHGLQRGADLPGGVLVWDVSRAGGSKGLAVMEAASLTEEAQLADDVWWRAMAEELGQDRAAELNEGRFSVMDVGSGHGLLSVQLAMAFPNATVVSLEDSPARTQAHYRLLERHAAWNNVVCNGSVSLPVVEKLYESPELLRYLAYRDDLLALLTDNRPEAAGKLLGMLVSSGLTTFLRVPTSAHVSLAMAAFASTTEDEVDAELGGPITLRGPVPDGAGVPQLQYSLSAHPTAQYEPLQTAVVRQAVRLSSGRTRVSLRHLADAHGRALPLLRLDLLNMTRSVHHHFDYKKDGHARTYTMRVAVNRTATVDAREALGTAALSSARLADSRLRLGRQSYAMGLGQHVSNDQVVSVSLERDSDKHWIPYTSVHGVTLIAIMRLGLLPALLDRAYSTFLTLPLYEDMAPWNIVFRGPALDYIDYDTRDTTFDGLIPKVYQILSVLMNYKRTVQDFARCSKDKARTPYGFSFVSDCVDSPEFRGPCDDPAKPVPCGDGQCHSDYITCLRAMVDLAAGASPAKEQQQAADEAPDLLPPTSSAEAFTFDKHGLVASAGAS